MGIIKSLFPKEIECYKNIETLPIFNWFKINETNDPKWLLHDVKVISKRQEKELQQVWKTIFDEFLDTFGIPEKMKKVYELKLEIFDLQCELHLTGNRTILTFIEIKTFDLEELTKEEKKERTNHATAHIEKFMGFRIDEKTITVKEYYTYLEVIKQASENHSPPLTDTEDE